MKFYSDHNMVDMTAAEEIDLAQVTMTMMTNSRFITEEQYIFLKHKLWYSRGCFGNFINLDYNLSKLVFIYEWYFKLAP